MLKPEIDFGLDNFGKQKVFDLPNSVAQMVINILLMRPGQLPSLPHIGINIKQYLYKFQEDIDNDYIRSQLQSQCADLSLYVDINSLQVIVFPLETESILFISLPLTPFVEENKDLLIGLRKNNNTNKVTFNYQITDSVTN